MPSHSLIVPIPVNIFHNKLAPNVYVMDWECPRTHPIWFFFASVLYVSLTSFINKTDSSSDLTYSAWAFWGSSGLVGGGYFHPPYLTFVLEVIMT